jgi:hypothetical protein
MDIILRGQHNVEDTAETLLSILKVFKEKYKIEQFREIYLTLTLVDNDGNDVELVDSQTSQVYRVFEVLRKGQELSPGRGTRPMLQLVIDNTR